MLLLQKILTFYNLPSVDTCDNPDITHGSVCPTDAQVNYESTYVVTCDTGYTISDADLSTLTCKAGGTLSGDPTCNSEFYYTLYPRLSGQFLDTFRGHSPMDVSYIDPQGEGLYQYQIWTRLA